MDIDQKAPPTNHTHADTEASLPQEKTADTPVMETITPDPLPAQEPIKIAPETIKDAGNALFMLWLKIGVTLILAKMFVIVSPVVVLLILSLMLVATFNPLVRRLQKRLTRAWAITAVVFGLLFTCLGILALMIPPLFRQAHNMMVQLPKYLSQIEQSVRKVGIPLKLKSNLDLTERAAQLGPETWNLLLAVFSGITGVLTIAALTTYLLIDGPRVATSTLSLLPRHQRLMVRQMFGEIGGQIGDYMRAQFITSGLAGLFSYLLLLALGVPEALALGFLMAISDAIPIVGPFIGTVPAVMMALTLNSSTAMIVLVAYTLYQQIEGHVLIPRIYGKTMQMSSTIIVLTLLIGATLMGILGALLALPAAAAIPVVYRYFLEWRQREEERQATTDQAQSTSNGTPQIAAKLPG